MSHAGHNTELDCSCGDCKLRYPKYFHPHAWENIRQLDSKKKIGDKIYYRDAQEELCKKYNVFVPLYRTHREQRWDKIEHYYNLFKLGLKKFKKALDKQHENNKKRKGKKGITLNDILGPPKSASFISNQAKDLDFITGRGKKPDMNFITGKSKKTNMNFITGGRKQNYSGLLSKNKPSSLSLGKKQNYSGLLGKKKRVKL